MDYLEKPEEFYEWIRIKKHEIKSLGISEDAKNDLYKFVDGMLQAFEKDRSNYLSEKIPKLNKALDKMGDGLGKIVNAHQRIAKELPNLGKTVFNLKIKKAFDSQNPLNN